MKRLFTALLIQCVLPFASAIEAFPIAIRSPMPEGARAIDIRVDAQSLYVKTSSNEIIRVDKLALLAGKVSASTATLEQWGAIKEPTSDLVSSDQNETATTWLLGNQTIRVKHAFCSGETEDKLHALHIDGRKVDTGLENCVALFDPLHFAGKLWFSTKEPSYSDLPGVGILIFDVARKRLDAKITKGLAGGDSGLMRVDAELNGVWVVNDQAIHFFDKSLKRKALAYYSEQFDPNGKNWSVIQVSKERRSHNQFAVAARIIMTQPINRSESDDVYAARLARNRWATVDGITEYKNAVARLSPRVRSNFLIEYNAFERQHYPFWGRTQMTQNNGGRQFKAASRLLSCLYEKAGSPPWFPNYLVLNVAAAAEGMNWAEFQLYNPKCDKRPATP